MSGKVWVRRDAGQVVAGDSVIHGDSVVNIDKYVNAPRNSVYFLVFFCSISLISIVGAMQGRPSCYYEGKSYSPGAVANMADQTHMTCTLTNGNPQWVRTKRLPLS